MANNLTVAVALRLAADQFNSQMAAARQSVNGFSGAIQAQDRALRAIDGYQTQKKALEDLIASQGASEAKIAAQRRAFAEAAIALQATGVNTQNLAAEQARLTASLAQSEAALRSAQGQVIRLGVEQAKLAASSPAAGIAKLSAASADAKGPTDNLTGAIGRLGGGLVAIAAAAGLTTSAIGLLTASVQSALKLEQLTNTLLAVSPNAKAAGDALAFVRAESNRLGLSLPVAASEFAKLTAATAGTALAGKATKDIFTAVSQASTVLGLSSAELGGALTAIQQIVSKGVVSAEELKGQLGERLPGAFQIAARSMSLTTEQLGKLLETGNLTAKEFLPKFAEELKKTFGPGVAASAAGARAEFERLKNAVFEAEVVFAKSGFLEGLREGASKLRQELEKPETRDALRSLGEALGKLAGFLVANIEPLAKVAAGLVAIATAAAGLAVLQSGVRFLQAFAGTLAVTSAAAATTTAATTVSASSIAAAGAAASAAAPKLALLARAFPLFAAFEFGQFLGEQIVKLNDAIGLTTFALDIQFRNSTIAATEFGKQLKDVTEKTIIANGQFATFAIKSSEEVKSANAAQLEAYRTGLLRAREYYRAVAAQAALDGRAEAEKSATAQAAAYGRAIDELTKFTEESAKRVEAATKAPTEGARKMVDEFNAALKSGKTTADALDEAFKDIDLGRPGLKVRDLLIALEKLRQDGKLTADEIRAQLEDRLAKLDPAGVKRYQETLKQVFTQMGLDAKTAAKDIDAALSASLKALGLDFDQLTTGISSNAKKIIQDFGNIASNANSDGKVISAAFAQALQGLNSEKEIKALIDAFGKAVDSGKISASQISQAFTLVRDKMLSLTQGTLEAAKAQTSLAQAAATTLSQVNKLKVDQAKLEESALKLEDQRIALNKNFTLEGEAQLRVAEAQYALDQQRLVIQQKQIELAKLQEGLQKNVNALKVAEAALAADKTNPALLAAAAAARAQVEAQNVLIEKANQGLIAANATADTLATQVELEKVAAEEAGRKAANEKLAADEAGRGAVALERQSKAAKEKEDAADREARRKAGATVDIFNADDDIATKIRKVQRAIQDQQVAASKSDIGIQAVVAPYVAQLQAILARLLVEQQNAAVKQRAETQRSTQQTTDIVATGARQASDALRSISDVRVRAPDLSLVDVAIQATQERVTAVRAAIQQLTGFVPLTNLDGTPFANSPATRAATNNGLFFPAPNNPALNAVENANQISAGVIRSGGFSGATSGAGAGTVNNNTYNLSLAVPGITPEQVRRSIIPVLEEVQRRKQ